MLVAILMCNFVMKELVILQLQQKMDNFRYVSIGTKSFFDTVSHKIALNIN